MLKKLLALLALLATALLQATTWHVATTGSDARSGRSWRHAFGTLQHALDIAAPGDEIHLAAGCYEPEISPGTIFFEAGFHLKPGVAIRGGFYGDEATPEERQRSDRDGNGVVEQWEFAGETILRLPDFTIGTILDGAEASTIPTLLEGLTILHGNALGLEASSAHPGFGGGAFLRGQYQVVACEFTGNQGVCGGAIYTEGPVRISESFFQWNTASNNGGALFHAGGDAQVYNCVFLENGDAGNTRDGGAIASNDFSSAEIAFCTFVGNGARNAGSTLNLQGETTLRSCVIWDSIGHPQSLLAQENCLVEHCATTAGGFPGKFAVGGILLASTNAGPNGLDANDNRPGKYYPCFADTDIGDFKLAKGSALIKRGSTNGFIPSIDAAGEVRTGTPSVGAYHSTLPRNAAVAIELTAPLYVGMSQKLEIYSDEPLDNTFISLDSNAIATLNKETITGIHEGTVSLCLDYTPVDTESTNGTILQEIAVLPRTLIIVANAQEWLPEIEDFPELTWEIKLGTLLASDRLEGELTAIYAHTGIFGKYPILQGTLGIQPVEHANDYVISFKKNVLTVKEYIPRIAQGDHHVRLIRELTYGDPLDGNTQLQGEFLDERTGDEVPGILAWKRDGEILPSGDHTLQWTFTPEDRRYQPVSEEIAVTISKRPLFITPNEKNLICAYGDSIPELTYTLDNFASGEDASYLLSPPVLGVYAMPSSPVGEYPVVLIGGADKNYTFVLRDTVFSISPRHIAIQMIDAEKDLDTEDPDFAWQIVQGEFLPGDEENIQIFREPGEAIGSYAIDARCTSTNYNLTVYQGTLSIHEPPPKQEVYLIVEDKTFQWGYELPDFTSFFSFSPDGTQPVPEDLFQYFDFVYKADTPDVNETTEINVEGIFNNRAYALTVIPGKLTCLPRILTPVWPELHKNFGEENPLITITALPEELPEGMDSFSDSQCTIEVFNEELVQGKYINGYYYPLAELPGVHRLRILPGEMSDKHFQWDTSVTGFITIGTDMVLIRKDAAYPTLKGTTVTTTLENFAGDSFVRNFTYGIDIFNNFQDAANNIFEGGTIWLESYADDVTHRKTIEISVACTLQNNYAVNPDADISLTLDFVVNTPISWFKLEGMHIDGVLRAFKNLTAENCTLQRIYCENCAYLCLRYCCFEPRTFPTWSYADSLVELKFINKQLGAKLIFDHVDFQGYIMKNDRNINIYTNDGNSTYENLKAVTNWPIDLTTCTFNGLNEHTITELRKHFFPYNKSTPNQFYLLP